MATSFFALLDDIAVLAKAAASSLDDIALGASKAAVKTAGVVIDDTAVTPQYVQGISPKRELPVVWRIARGSLLNKAIIIVVIMLLSVWAPWVLPWILIIGGTYLTYEGAEKVWHWINARRHKARTVEEIVDRTPASEDKIVSSAIRTDVVLSIEIMLIALANIDATGWGMRLAILVVVGIAMTALVYGTVAVLVKMDDVGAWLTRRKTHFLQLLGRGLVRSMPFIFRTLSVVGVIAMLWVGGHILMANLAQAGLSAPHDFVEAAAHPETLPKVASWFIDTGLAIVFGLLWGFVVLGIVEGIKQVIKVIKSGTRA